MLKIIEMSKILSLEIKNESNKMDKNNGCLHVAKSRLYNRT